MTFWPVCAAQSVSFSRSPKSPAPQPSCERRANTGSTTPAARNIVSQSKAGRKSSFTHTSPAARGGTSKIRLEPLSQRTAPSLLFTINLYSNGKRSCSELSARLHSLCSPSVNGMAFAGFQRPSVSGAPQINNVSPGSGRAVCARKITVRSNSGSVLGACLRGRKTSVKAEEYSQDSDGRSRQLSHKK